MLEPSYALCPFSCLCSVRLQSGMQSLCWILLPNASGRTPLRATGAASRKPPTGGRCRGAGLRLCSCWLETAAPTPFRAHCAACLSMTAVLEKGAGSMQTRNKAKPMKDQVNECAARLLEHVRRYEERHCKVYGTQHSMRRTPAGGTLMITFSHSLRL